MLRTRTPDCGAVAHANSMCISRLHSTIIYHIHQPTWRAPSPKPVWTSLYNFHTSCRFHIHLLSFVQAHGKLCHIIPIPPLSLYNNTYIYITPIPTPICALQGNRGRGGLINKLINTSLLAVLPPSPPLASIEVRGLKQTPCMHASIVSEFIGISRIKNIYI